MKITEYTLLTAFYVVDLENLVKDYIKQGWQPQGGVAVSDTEQSENRFYVQAMIKVAE